MKIDCDVSPMWEEDANHDIEKAKLEALREIAWQLYLSNKIFKIFCKTKNRKN